VPIGGAPLAGHKPELLNEPPPPRVGGSGRPGPEAAGSSPASPTLPPLWDSGSRSGGPAPLAKDPSPVLHRTSILGQKADGKGTLGDEEREGLGDGDEDGDGDVEREGGKPEGRREMSPSPHTHTHAHRHTCAHTHTHSSSLTLAIPICSRYIPKGVGSITQTCCYIWCQRFR